MKEEEVAKMQFIGNEPHVNMSKFERVQVNRRASLASCSRTKGNLLLKSTDIYDNSIQQPYLTLNDGNRIPMFGLGTWNAKGKELKDAVKAAIYAGYRHIDTAANYRNERLIGEAISECIDEGLVKRDDLFVTTKLWNNSHSRGSVIKALQVSLEALNLSYVDLYLIHYPIGYKEGDQLMPMNAQGQVVTSDVDYVDTWLGMEDAQRAKLALSIGVSNFNSQQISRILHYCSQVPAINQVECHPYLSQDKLIKFCHSHGIQLTSYSPLGSPGRQVCEDSSSCWRLDSVPRLMEDPAIVAIARKYQRPVAHILIGFQLKRGLVVIPKASKLAHIESNMEALSLELGEDDIKKLSSLNRNYRYMRFERCMKHKFYPFDRD